MRIQQAIAWLVRACHSAYDCIIAVNWLACPLQALTSTFPSAALQVVSQQSNLALLCLGLPTQLLVGSKVPATPEVLLQLGAHSIEHCLLLQGCSLNACACVAQKVLGSRLQGGARASLFAFGWVALFGASGRRVKGSPHSAVGCSYGGRLLC